MKSKYYRIILLASVISLACTTRVSEWVLINSIPNTYTLVYFHKDPLSELSKKQNQALSEKIKPANIQFQAVNRPGIDGPYYGLYYQNRLFSSLRLPMN